MSEFKITKSIKIPNKTVRQLQRTLPQLGKPFDLLWCDLKDTRKGPKAHPVAWGWISPSLLNFLNSAPDSLKATLLPTGKCEAKML